MSDYKYKKLYEEEVEKNKKLLSLITEKETWKHKAMIITKRIIRERNIDYIELAKKLEAIGIEETNNNISTKINRGSFSFVFFLQILEVLNIKTLEINDYENVYRAKKILNS